VDVQLAGSGGAQNLPAHRRQAGGGETPTAEERSRPDALDLNRLRRPGAQLRLEDDVVTLHPDPAPAPLDQQTHAAAPAARIEGQPVDAHLLAMHVRGGDDEA